MTNTKTAEQTFRITFERVGRHGGRNGSQPPAPVDLKATDAEDLAGQVWGHIRRFMASTGIEVVVDLERKRGQIYAGFSNGGSFTIEQLDPIGGGDGRG